MAEEIIESPSRTTIRRPHHNRWLILIAAFKLAQALLDAAPLPKAGDEAFLDGLLKLVALGTVADMVPLVGENALLVRRKRRLFWLAWSSAIVIGTIAMSGSMFYYFSSRS